MNLLALLRPYWQSLLLLLLLAAVPALAQGLLPALLVQPLFDRVLAGQEWQLLGGLLATGAGLLILAALGGYAEEAYVRTLSVRVPRDLRERLMAQMVAADLTRLPGSPAAIAGRILADLREIESFIFFGLGVLLVQGVTLLIFASLLFSMHFRLSLYLLLLVPPLAWLFGWIGAKVTGASDRTQAAAEAVAGKLHEGFSRLEVVQAGSLAGRILPRFAGVSRDYFRLGRGRALLSALHLPISQISTAVVLVMLLGLGVGEVRAGVMTPGDLTAYLTLLGLAIAPVQILSQAGMTFAQAEAAAARTKELLDLPAALPGRGARPDTVQGELEFDAVSFSYPGSGGLEAVSFRVAPGEFAALVGPSGAGKTTVLRLALGLFQPKSGEIRLDGRPLADYDLDYLRRFMAWVPQEPAFFAGTVRENLLIFEPKASPEQLTQVLAQVRLLEELPLGLDTPLLEETTGLSAGQRQRLAIAAALLRDARILLLDEITSAQDNLSEARVLAALEAARPGRTVIVVAHRLHTVERADRIVVLDQGRVVQTGTPAGLAGSEGLFQQLIRGQV